MIDRRKSAPLQLENAEKLESGQVEEGQVRACQIGRARSREVYPLTEMQGAMRIL
jgi:hypothetical protein